MNNDDGFVGDFELAKGPSDQQEGLLHNHSLNDRTPNEAAFLEGKNLIREILTICQEREELHSAVSRRQESQIAEQSAEFAYYEDPESVCSMLTAMSCFAEIKGVAHFKASCDFLGRMFLKQDWIAVRKGNVLVKEPSRGRARERFEITGGVVLKWWNGDFLSNMADIHHLPLPKVTISGPGIEKIGGMDPLEIWRARLPNNVLASLRSSNAMILGFVGTKVPTAACDVEPYCEHKQACHLFARKTSGEWQRRLTSADLIFTENLNADYRARMNIVRSTSLFTGMFDHIRTEQWHQDELLLSVLPGLKGEHKRVYLRRLLERCKAVEESRKKGLLFEQLASGILRLVPGWIPDTQRNSRTPENELDIFVRVEPESPKAKYWQSFGPKIIVECKNHKELKERSSRTAGEKISPVRKLYRVLERNRAKLGIIVNTGSISENLYREATDGARAEQLVVLFDGVLLKKIIDNPSDAEDIFKERIALGDIRVQSGTSEA